MLKWKRDPQSGHYYAEGDWGINIAGERGGRNYAWTVHHHGHIFTTTIRGREYPKVFDTLKDAKWYAVKKYLEYHTKTKIVEELKPVDRIFIPGDIVICVNPRGATYLEEAQLYLVREITDDGLVIVDDEDDSTIDGEFWSTRFEWLGDVRND